MSKLAFITLCGSGFRGYNVCQWREVGGHLALDDAPTRYTRSSGLHTIRAYIEMHPGSTYVPCTCVDCVGERAGGPAFNATLGDVLAAFPDGVALTHATYRGRPGYAVQLPDHPAVLVSTYSHALAILGEWAQVNR